MAMAALLIVVGLSAVVRGAEVADWPQMGRTAAFGSYKSVGLPSSAAPPHPEWTWGAAADRLVASPALWNGTVYLGSDDGHLYALDQHSGKRKWSYAQKCQPARSLLCVLCSVCPVLPPPPFQACYCVVPASIELLCAAAYPTPSYAPRRELSGSLPLSWLCVCIVYKIVHAGMHAA